ncbi:LysR family transcriptional regulator [Dongia deserti]|uniref:LysR family transcriptional regulator n=1 Tax=Dongia deserti TaxID=2268030 RepID=UPI000E65DEB5|nr:LysR family transcriptional regulator [Dongia deserti]
MRWNDFLYVLAVVQTGSALRAAERLGVNQATVLRRLDAIEAAAGAQFFERRRSGLKPTEIGRLAAEAALRMEREAQAFENTLAARRRTLAGSVRLTTSVGLADRLVIPGMRAFQSLYPSIVVELLVADEFLDIASGEADVALRAGSGPEGAGIVARRLPDQYWTVYCSHAYAAERGVPGDRAAIRGHEIVGLDGLMGRLPAWLWLKESAPDAVVRFRSNSLVNLVSNLKAGLGLGVLPTLIGDAEPELMRCLPPPPELRSELWLIVREDIKAQPHVRALTDFLANYIRGITSSATDARDASENAPLVAE